jgi:hypothetical protein
MKDYSNYMGGTNISLERLIELDVTTFVDGSHYPIKNWMEELEIFDSLEIGKSKVFIPYGGVEKHGILKRIEWNKHTFKHYNHTDETEDWWYFEPNLVVEYEGNEWFVYEYSMYEENEEVIHINRITPQTVEAFTPTNRSMGLVNEYEFNDLRVQIATHKLEGYYIKYNEKKHYIGKDGRLPFWSSGLFDLFEIQLSNLFKATR